MSFLPPSLSPLFTFLFPFSLFSSPFPPETSNTQPGLQSWTKVLGQVSISGALSNSHRSNPSPHPTNNVGRVYPEFFPIFNFVLGGGGGELQECTVLRGNREMTEKYEYRSTVPRTFVQDCSYNVAPLAGFSQSKKRVLYPQRSFLLSMMSFLSERSCDSQSEVRFQKESNSW